MPAGRPRKPIAEHLLNGTYRADRHGPLPSEAAPSGGQPDRFAVSHVLPAPHWLEGKFAIQWWNLWAKALRGVIGPIDEPMLSIAANCRGHAEELWRLLDKMDPASRQYMLTLRAYIAETKQADKILKRFGLV